MPSFVRALWVMAYVQRGRPKGQVSSLMFFLPHKLQECSCSQNPLGVDIWYHAAGQAVRITYFIFIRWSKKK